MNWILPFVLATLSAFGTAEPEVFDLGQLDQYTPKEKTPASLTGSSVWLSGTEEDGGFKFGVSPDVKAKVQGVLEGCGQLDDKCYQEAREVIRSADLEVDHKLERRHFGHFLVKTVKGGWAIFADFAANLYMSWYLKSKDLKGVDSFMFIPLSKASEAAKLQTATGVVVSANGTAVATITPKPDPTSIKGSHTPSVTAVTSAHDGLSQGDLVVYLDQNLASRMQEIMMRTTECDDGDKFDREHSSKRRASSRLGRAICAYQGVVINMGAALSDLLQTDLGVLNLVTPATPPDRAAAAEYAQQLMEDYAPLINLQINRARALAAYLFSLTIIVVVERQPLGPNNKIPSSLVQTGSPTNRPTQTTASTSSSSSSGCPDPTKTPLFCGQENDKNNNCQVVMPKADEEVPKCAEKGEHPNCPCNTPPDMIVQSASEAEIKAMNRFMELFNIPAQPVTPKGPTKALGIIGDVMETLPSFNDLANFNKVHWNFFATDYGKAVGCRWDPVRWFPRDIDRSKKVLWYPGGETALELFGEKCTYKNSGDNAGKLFCGDKAIECFWDPANKNPGSSEYVEGKFYSCKPNWRRQPVFTCPF